MEAMVAIRGELGRRVEIVVSGYEREEASNDYDANWLRTAVRVDVGNFHGSVQASFLTHDFVRFASSLDRVLELKETTATFDTDEGALSLNIAVDRVGRATVSGSLKDIDANVTLTFSFDADITFLRESRSELQHVLVTFPQRAV